MHDALTAPPVAGRHRAHRASPTASSTARASAGRRPPAALRRQGPPVGGARRARPPRAAVRQRRRADRRRRQRRHGLRRDDEHRLPGHAAAGQRRRRTRTSPTARRRCAASSASWPSIAARRDLSGAPPVQRRRPARPTRCAIAPKHDGGLIGAAELAWDAASGTPLRAAIYAAGAAKPVLELDGHRHLLRRGRRGRPRRSRRRPARRSTTSTSATRRTRTRGGRAPAGRQRRRRRRRALPLPAQRARRARRPAPPARCASSGRRRAPGALVTYGAGLGGIAVLEQPPAAPARAERRPRGLRAAGGRARRRERPGAGHRARHGPAFERGGVRYTVIGSVPPAAAEAAAEAL